MLKGFEKTLYYLKIFFYESRRKTNMKQQQTIRKPLKIYNKHVGAFRLKAVILQQNHKIIARELQKLTSLFSFDGIVAFWFTLGETFALFYW